MAEDAAVAEDADEAVDAEAAFEVGICCCGTTEQALVATSLAGF